MPISVPGRSSPRYSNPGRSNFGQSRRSTCGFTLLEMMVVLLVFGISLGIVTPHFMKNDDEVLKEESLRLVALIEYAADSASSRGLWLAWSPTASGYRFLQRDENKNVWQPVTTDEVLRERQLPEGMRLGASSQQQVAVPPNALIALSPSGIHAPFQIELRIGKDKRIVRGNLIGQVEMLTPGVGEGQVL